MLWSVVHNQPERQATVQTQLPVSPYLFVLCPECFAERYNLLSSPRISKVKNFPAVCRAHHVKRIHPQWLNVATKINAQSHHTCAKNLHCWTFKFQIFVKRAFGLGFAIAFKIQRYPFRVPALSFTLAVFASRHRYLIGKYRLKQNRVIGLHRFERLLTTAVTCVSSEVWATRRPVAAKASSKTRDFFIRY